MKEQLKPGEVLLVRFRLQSPAAVHLRLSGPKASLGVWADGRADSELQPALLPAGEHALVANAQVLAVKTEEYGSPMRVTLVAAPDLFPAGVVSELAKLEQDPARLAARCPSCALDVLEVLPPPEGVLPEASFR